MISCFFLFLHTIGARISPNDKCTCFFAQNRTLCDINCQQQLVEDDYLFQCPSKSFQRRLPLWNWILVEIFCIKKDNRKDVVENYRPSSTVNYDTPSAFTTIEPQPSSLTYGSSVMINTGNVNQSLFYPSISISSTICGKKKEAKFLIPSSVTCYYEVNSSSQSIVDDFINIINETTYISSNKISFNINITGVQDTYFSEDDINNSYVNDSFINDSYINDSFINDSSINDSFINDSYNNDSYINDSFINDSYNNDSYVNDSSNNAAIVDNSDSNSKIDSGNTNEGDNILLNVKYPISITELNNTDNTSSTTDLKKNMYSIQGNSYVSSVAIQFFVSDMSITDVNITIEQKPYNNETILPLSVTIDYINQNENRTKMKSGDFGYAFGQPVIILQKGSQEEEPFPVPFGYGENINYTPLLFGVDMISGFPNGSAQFYTDFQISKLAQGNPEFADDWVDVNVRTSDTSLYTLNIFYYNIGNVNNPQNKIFSAILFRPSGDLVQTSSNQIIFKCSFMKISNNPSHRYLQPNPRVKGIPPDSFYPFSSDNSL